MTDTINYEELYFATKAEVEYLTKGFERKIETDRLHHCAVVDALEYQIEQRDEAFEKIRKELNDLRHEYGGNALSGLLVKAFEKNDPNCLIILSDQTSGTTTIDGNFDLTAVASDFIAGFCAIRPK